MTDVQFGRLQDLPLRDAWKHEAHSFTPWLAENIDHISEAIGMTLELTGQEVRVESFAADILARNPQDDSLVLIENQLEATDHTHLGQIMTYLAGLEAKTVIWIAPSFREPHLAVIRWLNEHTADDFSFFAMRLRVVRIGNSPFAPIFEIVEKPNDWSRALSRQTETGQSIASGKRKLFWQAMLQRHPEAGRFGIRVTGASNITTEVVPGKLLLGRYIATNTSGVYLKGPNGADVEEARALLAPYRERLRTELLATLDDAGGWVCYTPAPHPLRDEAGWPAAADFLHTTTQRYLALLDEIFPERVP